MKYSRSTSDDRLVALFVEGEATAFDEILSRYHEELFRYIFLLVNDQDCAHDLFQDTFIKVIALLREGRYKPNGKFKAWLVRVAHNVVMDHFRHKGRHPAEDPVGDNDYLFNDAAVPYASGMSDAVLREEQFAFIEQQITTLPDEQQTAIRLRFYEGKSFKEIAQITGVSIGTALGRVRYALINLRKTRSRFQAL